MVDAFLAQFFEGVLILSLIGAVGILSVGMILRWIIQQSLRWWNR